MPRQPMPDNLKPKHVLSFRATDKQRTWLERKYGTSSKALLRLVEDAMRKDATTDEN